MEQCKEMMSIFLARETFYVAQPYERGTCKLLILMPGQQLAIHYIAVVLCKVVQAWRGWWYFWLGLPAVLINTNNPLRFIILMYRLLYIYWLAYAKFAAVAKVSNVNSAGAFEPECRLNISSA